MQPTVRGTTDGADCAHCPFARDGKPVEPVVSEGPAAPAWILVGEGPGEMERRSGRPFIGPSGKLMENAMRSVGARRETIHVTNALCCTPPGASDTQKALARRCCEPRLERELDQFPTTPVLAVGAVAGRSMLGESMPSIFDVAGSYFVVPSGKALGDPPCGSLWTWEDHQAGGVCTCEKLEDKFAMPSTFEHSRGVIPTVHPALILRGGNEGAAHAVDLLYVSLVYDVNKIQMLGSGEITGPLEQEIYTETESPKRAEELIDWIVYECRKIRRAAIDVETDSLRMREANMNAIAIATKEASVSIMWHLATKRTKRLVGGLLADPMVMKIYHNKMYDPPVLRRYGFKTNGRQFCTMLAHHCAFPGLPHDLQRVVSQFAVVEPWKSEYRGGDQTPEEHTTYNAQDAGRTAWVAEKLEVCVEKSPSAAAFEADLIMGEIAARMHEVGIPLSFDRNDELQAHFKSEMTICRKLIEEEASDPKLQDKIFDRVAFEQAKEIRVGTGKKDGSSAANRLPDPSDFLTRHGIRLAELQALYEKNCTSCLGNGTITEEIAAKVNLRRTKNPVAVGRCSECAATGRGWSWNINAPVDIAAYLKAKGLPLFAETASGKLSTKADVLESLGYRPEIQDLIAYREARGAFSTHVVAPRVASDKTTRRFYPIWKPTQISGRMASEDPAMSNLSKGRKGDPCKVCGKLHGRPMPNLRSQIIAPKGRRFVAYDKQGLEARVIGLLSGDPWLLDVFSHPSDKFGPGDIHTRFALEVWPDFMQYPKEERSELREFIKPMEYGGFYGGSVDTLLQNILKDNPHVLRADVERVAAVLSGTLTGVTRWHNELIAQVQKPPHKLIEPILGRTRWFPLGNGPITDIYNFPCQAAGRSIVLNGYMRFWPQFKDVDPSAEIILDGHDATVIEVDEEKTEPMKALVKDCWDDEYTVNGITVKFPCKPLDGATWAEVS